MPPIIVAIVDGYSGTAKPTIGPFTTGNSLDLDLDFVLNSDNEWEMIVQKQQDYEQVLMQRYLFTIINDGKSVTVQISINNIFDNAPVMTSVTNPCSIPVN